MNETKKAIASSTRKQAADDRNDVTTNHMTYMVIKTICMVLGPVALGIFLELAGPTLPDLQDQVNANYEEISRALVARSAGYLVSSLVSGILVDRFPLHRELVLSFAFLLAAIGTFFVPWTRHLWVLGILFHLQGLGQGTLDTSNNAICLGMWAKRASAPVHALHFGFGVGAFIAPQLARPFISSPITNSTTNVTTLTQEARLEIPYTISTIISFIFFLLFMGFYIYERRHGLKSAAILKASAALHHVSIRTKMRRLFAPGTCANGDACFSAIFFILLFIFYINTVGGERACSKFIYSYATERDPPMSAEDATTLNSVYWIAFTCGRGVTIIIAKWLPPYIMLFIEITANIAAAVVLVVWSDIPIVLWVFTGVLGFFMAPVFPGGLALSNRYVLMNGVAVAIVFIGSSVGGMIYQWVTGYLFEYHGAYALWYVILGFAVFLAAVYIIMYLLVRRRPQRFHHDVSERQSLQDFADGDDGSVDNKEGRTSTAEL